MLSNLFYCPAMIVRMLAIIATVPRLMPTTIHRALLGIDRSFKTCQILYFFSCNWRCAFLSLASCLFHCNSCDIDLIFCGHCMYSKIAPCCQANAPHPFYSSQDYVLDRVNISVVYNLIGKLKVWYTFLSMYIRCTYYKIL
jgi:hypothetical protein